MRTLPKNVLQMRFNNINIYRKKLIKEAKEKRKKIIDNTNSSNSIVNNIQHFSELEKDIQGIEDKDKKDIEKYQQMQNNQIDLQIEGKMKIELLKYQNELKENLIKDMNEKIKEERRQKIIYDEQKEKEKELFREKLFKKQTQETELKKENILKIEERRLQDLRKMHEKAQSDLLFRSTQKSLSIEKKKKFRLQMLKDEELKNRMKQEEHIKKEKQRKEELEKKKKERLNYNLIKMKENEKKVIKSKMQQELTIKKMRNEIDIRERLTKERLNDIFLKKSKTLEDKKKKFNTRIEFVKNTLQKSKENLKERNKKIMQHQEHINEFAAQQELLKSIKILEKAKSQNDLYLKTIIKRDLYTKKIMSKIDLLQNKTKKIEKKISEGRDHKLLNLTLKQEDQFIKQYELNHTLMRLTRINSYQKQRKAEEKSEKERKLDMYKNKKQKLKEDKFRKTNYIRNQKQKIITKFENALSKNKLINPEIIRKLLPHDNKLYNRIKFFEEKIFKKDNDSSLKNSSLFNISSSIKNDDLVFLTQKKNIDVYNGK